MACFNKNTAEYKALQEEFKKDSIVDAKIMAWQRVNNSDVIPSVDQVQQGQRDKQVMYSTTKRNFSAALIGNLNRLKLVTKKYKGSHYVNTTNGEQFFASQEILKDNIRKIYKYLAVNNIPSDAININRTTKSAIITVNEDMFSVADVIPAKRPENTTRTLSVVEHLERLFPQVTVNIATVSEAKEYYDSLPKDEKAKIKFADMNSYYQNGKAVLIQGRVTDETAIEELLHPFVDAAKTENPELFDNLLKESKLNFPVLKQEIDDAYSNKNGFKQVHRDLELVTQAMTRHFQKEYEDKPTKSFLDRIVDFLRWFGNLINDLHKYVTEKQKPVFQLSQANPNLKLSEIAQILNTTDISFKFNYKVDNVVRYSLSNKKQKIVNRVKDVMSANPLQKKIIDKLFHIADKQADEIDSLSANPEDITYGNSIVILNKEQGKHEYVDISTGEIYTSATTAINGVMQNREEVAESLAVGNDFDSVVEAVITGVPVDELFAELQAVPESKLKNDKARLESIYDDIHQKTMLAYMDGTVFIPQVVVYDRATKIAGTADIVGITTKGEIRIIDLKTSRTAYISKNKEQYKREWDLADDSKLKQAGVNRMSTLAKHGLQVNMYRRMFENMGYKVEQGPYSAQTFHIHVDMEGKGKNTKWKGTYRFDGLMQHPPLPNNSNLDKLIPKNPDIIAKEKIEFETKNSDTYNPFNTPDESLPDDEFASPIQEDTRYKGIKSAVENYQKHLVDRAKALEQYKKQLFVDKTNPEALDYINNTLATILVSLDPLRTDQAVVQSKVFVDLIRMAIKEMDTFIAYVNDPKNLQDKNFITYINNFDNFAKSYEALNDLGADLLNKNELRLINQLQTKLKKVRGTNYLPGLIDTALEDWAVQTIKQENNLEYTEAELRQLIKKAEDTNFLNLNTRDMATSPDTILAVIDKLYKRQKLRAQIIQREEVQTIRTLGNRLTRLAGTNDPTVVFKNLHEDPINKPGKLVEKFGKQYNDRAEELRNELFHANGDWKRYIQTEDINTPLTEEEIQYNIELWNAKQANAAFMRAETKDENNNPVDGEFHRYTDEFKKIRDKYQIFIPVGNHGFWRMRSGISQEQTEEYYLKYYDTREVETMIMLEGKPTGKTRFQTLRFPKKKFVEKREVSSNGVNMLSDKYVKLMNPTTELGRAEKDFYEAYMELSDKMMKKLPLDVRDRMLGFAPLVKAKMVKDAKSKGMFGFVRDITKYFGDQVNDVLTETTSFRRVQTDEYGNMIDSIPIMFVGRPRTQKAVQEINDKLEELEARRVARKVTGEVYQKQKSFLESEKRAVLGKPEASEISMDLADSIIKFSSMATIYEQMTDIEDTLLGLKKIVDRRQYVDTKKGIVRYARDLKDTIVGKKGSKSQEEANTKKRLSAWFSMVFYNSDEMTRSIADKLTSSLIGISSLTYVAFNAIGNLNNLAIASVNNAIEGMGQRFFSLDSYKRANKAFYADGGGVTVALFSRLAYKTSSKNGRYDPDLAMNKWEAMAQHMFMMDAYADIREATQGQGAMTEGFLTIPGMFEGLKRFGYSLQDAAEYKVQTTVGMAILMDTLMENSKTGEQLSFYDAHDYDAKTQTVKLKEGFDTIITKTVNNKEIKKLYDINERADLRNNIREVNKQIHGNYAREDRVLLQRHNIGQLLFQFKKWLAPAIRARFQGEYYDENLGWMEGRYVSTYKFLGYLAGQLKNLNFKAMNFKSYRDEVFGKKSGSTEQENERIQNKIFGIKRTAADLAMIIATWGIYQLLLTGFEDEDDDMDPTLRKLRNLAIYQANRTYKELSMFMPILPGAYTQMSQFTSDPIASTRNLGQIGEMLSTGIYTGYRFGYAAIDGLDGVTEREYRELMKDSDLFYQYKPRKGKLKLWKETADVIPGIYTIQKFNGFLRRQDFYID
jgi:hypothetical protein